MNENVDNSPIALSNRAFHLVGDVMPFAHRNLAVHFHVKIDIKAESHFANKKLLDLDHTGNSSCGIANYIDNFTAWRSVENFVNRRTKKPDADASDDKADKNRGPIVGAAPLIAANQGNRNSNERSDRAQHIGSMAPRVGFDCHAFDRFAEAQHVAKKRFLHHDDGEQNQQSEAGRLRMWQKHCPRTFDCHGNRGDQDNAGNKDRGERFGFAMAVRVRFIGRPGSEPQATPDDDRTGYIQDRFDSVGHQCVGIPENAAENFDDRERDVHDQTNQCKARANLQISRDRLRLRRIHRMNKTIKVVVYETHGNPAEVLQIKTEPWPSPAAGEAVVQMLAAPINPADINAIEGKYPARREVPAVPGFEGAGVVVETGADVSTIRKGALVILPHNIGTWREAVAVKANDLVAVPPEIDPVSAAMLKINPMTAWRLLHDYVDLARGDWVIQNAANSAVGRAVIQIARELGFKTVNVVRRPELIDELQRDGGDVVLVDRRKIARRSESRDGRRADSLGIELGRRRQRIAIWRIVSPSAERWSVSAR